MRRRRKLKATVSPGPVFLHRRLNSSLQATVRAHLKWFNLHLMWTVSCTWRRNEPGRLALVLLKG